MTLASFIFAIAGHASLSAQTGDGAQAGQTASDRAAGDGAAGRGVRILPPEPPKAPTVVNRPKVQQAPANATSPRPAAQPGKQATAPTPLPVLKSCDRPVARPTLRFGDPARFDSAFKAKLRGGRSVVVDIDTPYPADNEAPLPLGAWLNEVKQSGGTVTIAPYCVKGRGIGGFFAKLFGGGPAEPYKAVRRYDAVLHVDAVDQNVTQIEFTPRKAAR
ncbi:hypothetical protein [Sphingobium sp.]|uniref:hypothetical protein n=1 Tax=Sphingobium sp. TaxID=1912891 RepID=UPI003B3AF9E5